MVFEGSGACFSQLKGRSHVGYSEGALPKVIVPRRQNLSLLNWERKVRFWGAIVGGQGLKTINKENKGISKRGTS